VFEVAISSMSPARFRSVLSPARFEAFEQGMRRARALLAGRVIWNVNSTARGGGVAELLESLVAYARGAGVDVRWVVIEGTPEFFAVTKRLHNRLHGTLGDGGPLDDGTRAVYEQVLADNLPGLIERVRPGDVVIVHDPQPAGLIAELRAAGAAVIWRCHVGLDRPNDLARGAWEFLRPYIADADAYVFSRESFTWEGLDRDRIAVIPLRSMSSHRRTRISTATPSGVCSARAACWPGRTTARRPPSSVRTAPPGVWNGGSSCSAAARCGPVYRSSCRSRAGTR
jgi:trehalose synthase